ncbi:MAG: tRNA (guanosine(37)-N1)-methyltransferase TrmD [Bacteroidales bacterium]
MRIDIISIFPEMFVGFLEQSIIKRSIDKGIAEIYVHNLRDYSKNKHRKVDDYAFGGEAGMVMMVQPIADCINSLTKDRTYDEIIFLTPDGELFEQKTANELSCKQNLILLCGRYKGVDNRVREHLITREISVGNYVLTGGEIAAAVVTDAVIRLIPGVLSDETSALSDSFQNGLLSHPVYTRPADYNGWKVPEVLVSGNEKLISEWKLEQAIKNTEANRPDMLE